MDNFISDIVVLLHLTAESAPFLILTEYKKTSACLNYSFSQIVINKRDVWRGSD